MGAPFAGIKVAGDTQGNTYVLGGDQISIGTLHAGIPRTFGTFTLTSKGGTNGYVTRMDSQFKIAWALQLGSSKGAGFDTLCTDDAGDVYVGGMSRANGSLGTKTYTVPPSGLGVDCRHLIARIERSTGKVA